MRIEVLYGFIINMGKAEMTRNLVNQQKKVPTILKKSADTCLAKAGAAPGTTAGVEPVFVGLPLPCRSPAPQVTKVTATSLVCTSR